MCFVCELLCDVGWFVIMCWWLFFVFFMCEFVCLCVIVCVVLLLNECAAVLCGVFCGVVWFACFACLRVPVCVWC